MAGKVVITAAEQWHLYRRLRAAGCQLDYDHLPLVPAPLRVSLSPWAWSTHIFPMGPGTAVVIPLRMVGLRACTMISAWKLIGSGFAQAQFLEYCPLVSRTACWQDGSGLHHHLTLDRSSGDLRDCVFKAGMWTDRYLVFLRPGRLSAGERCRLVVTLEITDQFFDRYPFDLSLTYDPEAAVQASAGLVTRYRAPEKTAPTPSVLNPRKSVLITTAEDALRECEEESRAHRTQVHRDINVHDLA